MVNFNKHDAAAAAEISARWRGDVDLKEKLVVRFLINIAMIS